MTGIYIHVPFCEHKCGYCDFYSATNIDKYEDLFVDALLKEIEIRASLENVDTIFFGGGTPSLLSKKNFEEILKSLEKNFRIAKNSEITLEANPETVNFEKLRFLKDLGFNRLSFGVQSFIEKELKFMERIHSAKKAKSAYFDARKAGFKNISLDLILGLPEQKFSDMIFNLQEAINLEPDHISAYSLIFEPETRFYKLLKKGKIHEISNENDRKFYEKSIQFFEENSFFQYEVSNYAKKSQFFSKHNLKYWNMQPYLGFGPSAHSFDGKLTRSFNPPSTKKYIESLQKNELILEEEILSEEEHILEWLMLGFRKSEGINMLQFSERFSKEFLQLYKSSVEKYKKMGLMKTNTDFCFLTKEGRFYIDEIVRDF
jgi:oxygen-independent coproporphyrinogen-3 oxidase